MPYSTTTAKPTSITTDKPPSTTATLTKPTVTNPGTGACAGITNWEANKAYNGSQTDAFDGHLWQAKWWTPNESPSKQGVWTDLRSC
ncbi:Chitinase 4 [Basidiobolus ranarum]|uniref:Chitinase 4 n=1 Tax=Basidiobolus ranarum TaxID=34480 RepID=A0ABR2VJZ9_9FUNG